MQKIFQAFMAVLFLFTTGCSPNSYPFFSDEASTVRSGPLFQIDSVELTYVLQEFTTELKYNKHLILEQAKAFYDDGIHGLQLEFITQNIMEMCEARDLIVDLTEDLLSRINLNDDIASQLTSAPLLPKNLEIYITFESYFGRYIDPNYIKWICLEDGLVTYYTFDVEDVEKRCWHSRHETYETSRRISRAEESAEEQHTEGIEQIEQKKRSVFGTKRFYPQNT